jgi:hypothetical protein
LSHLSTFQIGSCVYALDDLDWNLSISASLTARMHRLLVEMGVS